MNLIKELLDAGTRVLTHALRKGKKKEKDDETVCVAFVTKGSTKLSTIGAKKKRRKGERIALACGTKKKKKGPRLNLLSSTYERRKKGGEKEGDVPSFWRYAKAYSLLYRFSGREKMADCKARLATQTTAVSHSSCTSRPKEGEKKEEGKKKTSPRQPSRAWQRPFSLSN